MKFTDQAMSLLETAFTLGVSERSLLNWHNKGIGPKRGKAPNGSVFYLRADVDDFRASLLDQSSAA